MERERERVISANSSSVYRLWERSNRSLFCTSQLLGYGLIHSARSCNRSVVCAQSEASKQEMTRGRKEATERETKEQRLVDHGSRGGASHPGKGHAMVTLLPPPLQIIICRHCLLHD